MSSSVIGMFDDASEVSSVKSDLISLGIDSSQIQVQSAGSSSTGAATSGATTKGFWEELKEMFGGESQHHADYYAEGTRRGSTLVTVDAPDALADQAADLMRQHGAINIDDRAAEWSKSGWTGYQAAATTPVTPVATQQSYATAGAATASTAATVSATTTDETPVALQEAEEQLDVGKRQVLRGGVRVVRRVVERPVEESVRLREEKVNVDRRPADRALTSAEADEVFTDRAVELTEVGEEAVAAKSARVVGEVVVDKTAAERVETVRDTLRSSDVRVERLPGQTAGDSSSTTKSDTFADAPVTSRADLKTP